MSKVTVGDLWNYFHYRRICGDDDSFNRSIHEASINRPGLELSGYFDFKPYQRVAIIGEKEYGYIQKMSVENQEKAFDYLTHERVPAIIIASDLPCPEVLLRIAQQKNFPIFSSFARTSTLIVEIVSFLEKYFAPVESVHGVLMQIHGRGVLITGESGVGKSEIALELINKGHLLVADDRVDLYRIHNGITGEAPEVLKDMLEIRGVGIIDVASMFGVSAVADTAELDLIIYIAKWDKESEYDRTGLNEQDTVDYFGIKIPKITIPTSEGRSIATVIEAAVTNHILKIKGYDSSKILDDRVIELINKQKENH